MAAVLETLGVVHCTKQIGEVPRNNFGGINQGLTLLPRHLLSVLTLLLRAGCDVCVG